MSLSGKIAWNTLIQMIGKFSSTIVGIIIVAILTRYLTKFDYGTFTFITVFVTMFGAIADWGLTLITVREASKNAPYAGEIIGNTVLVRLILAIGGSLAAAIAIRFINPDPQIQILVTLASLWLIALSLKTSFQIIFNVKLKMQNWAISEVVANLVVLTLLLLIVQTHGGLQQIILAYLAANFVAAGVAAGLAIRMQQFKFSLFTPKTKYLLTEALPMGSLLVLFTVYNRLDTVILSFVGGQVPVATYGVAYRIFEVLILGAAYFSNSILPIISNLAVTDKKKMGLVYQKSFLILAWLGIIVALGNFFLAPSMVRVVAGANYADSVVPLRILSLALIVSYFNHLNGYTLIALHKQWSSFGIALAALAVNLVLNVLFIPHYSYVAAAVNTFITEALIVVCSLWVIKKETGVLPRFTGMFTIIGDLITYRGKIFNIKNES